MAPSTPSLLAPFVYAVTDASSSPKDTSALDFKSATLYAVRVVLHSANLNELLETLDRRMTDARGFFEDEPVVVDTSGLADTIDWPTFVDALRQHRLRPIGAVGNAANLEQARKVGLEAVDLSHGVARAMPSPATASPAVAAPASAIDPAGTTTLPTETVGIHPGEPASTGTSSNESTSTSLGSTAATAGNDAADTAAPPMIIDRPLRSGQRIYARNADLIVVGMVSQGAEVIADGNIHVYGPLRGKAMAGARGDTSARIFTTQLDPELLAIAGVYRVIESALDPLVLNQPAIVHLGGETLQIVPVGTKG